MPRPRPSCSYAYIYACGPLRLQNETWRPASTARLTDWQLLLTRPAAQSLPGKLLRTPSKRSKRCGPVISFPASSAVRISGTQQRSTPYQGTSKREAPNSITLELWLALFDLGDLQTNNSLFSPHLIGQSSLSSAATLHHRTPKFRENLILVISYDL